MRNAFLFTAALVAGLGAALVFAAPAQADAPFTVVVDKSAPLYPTSTLSWSGTHDSADPVAFALRTAADPDGVSIDATCTDGPSGSEPIGYTCSYALDSFPGMTAGDWELVGSMPVGGGTGLENQSDTFTVVDAATVSVTDSPVPQGGVLRFGGSKASTVTIEQYRLIRGEGETSFTPDCTGADDPSTTWSCSATLDPEIGPGGWVLDLTIFDANGRPSHVSADFEVSFVEPSTLVYTTGPGSLTVSGIPIENVDDNIALRLFSWAPGGDGDTTALLYDCIVGSPDSGDPYVVAQSQGYTLTCAFPIQPGVVQAFLENEGPGTIIDSYFVFPAPPAGITSRGSDNGSGTISGTGAAGDTVHVESAGATLCSPHVDASGAWQCSLSELATGDHPLSIWEENADNPVVCDDSHSCPSDGDPEVVYRSGGRSTVVTGILTITAPPVLPPTGTALTTPVWSFSIDGIDTGNLHPGDTFTATGSGLPAGATVTFVLHSTPVTLGQTVVAGDGTFSFLGTIPLDVEPGAHQIIATLSGTGLVSTSNAKDVTVTAVVPASDDQSGAGDQSSSDDQSSTDSASGSGREHDAGIRPEVAPNVLTNGLDSIGDVVKHPEKVPAAIAIGLVLLVLGILPAHLLNATLAEQWERLGRRHPRLVKGPGWLARLRAALDRAPAIGGLAVTTATAVLFCFADPRFGFSLESLRLIIALAAALFVVTYVVDWVTKLIVRGAWDAEVTIRLRPLGLVLALVGVVASRALHFSPGFLIGLVLGLSIAGHAAGRYAWRAVLIRAGLIIGLALAAWVGFSAFSGDAAEHDFTSALLLELLVAIATEGTAALMIELLPFHLLEGERVYARTKLGWGVAYLATLVIFIVAVVPWEGNWATLGSGLWAWLAVLVAFAVIALTVYVVFRVRSRRDHEVEDDERADRPVSINED